MVEGNHISISNKIDAGTSAQNMRFLVGYDDAHWPVINRHLMNLSLCFVPPNDGRGALDVSRSHIALVEEI